MNNINNSHSLIIDYPIDYNIFPLANNCEIYKVVLNKNEYLTIPKFWFHWVYTDPFSVSISYDIPHVNFILEENNHFYNSFKFSNPYKGTHHFIDIKYNDFINTSLNDEYQAIVSETSDCSPVIKNNLSKFFYNDTLSNIISKYSKDYIYIGHNTIYETNILYSLKHINTLINKNCYNEIYYKSTVWFTLDKTSFKVHVSYRVDS